MNWWSVRRSSIRCDAANLIAWRLPELPLDILAQQIVAASAAEEWTEDASVRDDPAGLSLSQSRPANNSIPIIRMLAEGFSTKRGKRSAYLHHDAVNQRIRGRRNARDFSNNFRRRDS